MIEKEAFIAAVVHDLRAPLNACLMSLSLLELKASQPGEVLKSVDVVRRNLEKQAVLIDDLADAMQIVAGGLELECGSCDLAEVVEAGVEAALSISANVDVRIEPGGYRLDADLERLGRAFAALLEILGSRLAEGERITFTAAPIERGVRVGVGPESSAGAQQRGASGVGKRSAMRLTVATEIIARHGGAVSLDEALPGCTVELPLRA